MKRGLQELGTALVGVLPAAANACNAGTEDVERIYHALASFASPESFVYHAGSLLVNSVDIHKDIFTSIQAYKQQGWSDFGKAVGDAMRLLVMGGSEGAGMCET